MTSPVVIVTWSVNSVPVFSTLDQFKSDRRVQQVLAGEGTRAICHRLSKNLIKMMHKKMPSPYHRVSCLGARACLNVCLSSSNPGV